MALQRFVRTCIRVAESVQVELHGQYSVERMKAFGQYCDTASYWRVALVLLLVPMPCLVVIVLVDWIPLEDPALGLQHSTLFWLRSAIVSFFVSFMVLEQCRHFVPKLRMTLALVLVMALGATVATTLTEISMAHAIGYPVPFTIVASVPARLTLLGIWFQLKWGKAFRDDPSIMKQLMMYIWGLTAQTSLTMIYPVFNFVFLSLDSTGQTALTMVLPVIKLAAKNWISYAYAHLEDLKPEMVIFNVELFHALFLSCCMQSSRSGYTLALLVAVDYIQAGLSIIDVNNALQRIAALHSAVYTELSTALAAAPDRTMLIQSALQLLSTDELLCQHPSVVSGARLATLKTTHSTAAQLQLKSVGWVACMKLKLSKLNRVVVGPYVTAPAHASSVIAVKGDDSNANHVGHLAWKSAAAVLPSPRSAEKDGDVNSVGSVSAVVSLAKPKFVRQVLQLLHLTEFVLMIEFTEVVIPVIYSVYIIASYNLPNRRFYAQFTESSDVALVRDNIENVMRYAALELLSFVLFCVAVWWRVQFSTLRQLAFVFERQWPLVQTKIVIWVLFTVQLQLYHFGSDASFQFRWLEDKRV